MVVSDEKVQVGWRVPAEIRDEFYRIAGNSANGKQHWAIFSAAVLLLSAADDSLREDLIDASLSADRRGDFKPLIERAQAGDVTATSPRRGARPLAAKTRGKP